MADLEERRATMTEAEEETKPRTTRPALDVLDHDQDRLLYHGDPARNPSIQPLSDGFDDARSRRSRGIRRPACERSVTSRR